MDLVSIVVPVYNVKKYLNKCVKSILKQTYLNIEVILVDDGSNDGSAYICDSYKKIDPRIKVIHKINGGLSDARNAGIKAATGKYLMFVDSDDYISSQMVKDLVRSMVLKKVDLVMCGYLKVDYRGKVLNDRENEIELENKLLKKNEFWNLFFGDCLVFCVVAWNKLYKRELFENGVVYEKGKNHEDVFIISRIIDQCSKIYVIKKRLYYYMQRTDSIMHQGNIEDQLDECEAFIGLADYFADNGIFNYAVESLNSLPRKFSLISSSLNKHDERKNRYLKVKKKYIESFKKIRKSEKKASKFLIKSYLFIFCETLFRYIVKFEKL